MKIRSGQYGARVRTAGFQVRYEMKINQRIKEEIEKRVTWCRQLQVRTKM